jgi:hypothetical protein
MPTRAGLCKKLLTLRREIVVDVFLIRPEKERKRLIERGIVRMVEQWKDAYYGPVTVELFS